MMRWTLVTCFLFIAGLSQAGSVTESHSHEHHDDSAHANPELQDTDPRLAQARRLQQRHDFSGAADLLAELLQTEPFNIEAQLLHADVLLHDGKIDESRMACIRVSMSGAQTLAGYCAIQTLTAAGEHERALSASKNLVPDNLSDAAQVWALEIAADAAWKAGDIQAARVWFERAMAFESIPHSTEDAYEAFLEATR